MLLSRHKDVAKIISEVRDDTIEKNYVLDGEARRLDTPRAEGLRPPG